MCTKQTNDVCLYQYSKSAVYKTKSAEFVDFVKSAEFVDFADFVGKKLQTFAIPSNYANVQAQQ
jgi:hypothetical protein